MVVEGLRIIADAVCEFLGIHSDARLYVAPTAEPWPHTPFVDVRASEAPDGRTVEVTVYDDHLRVNAWQVWLADEPDPYRAEAVAS